MSDSPSYLTDESTVEKIYSFLKKDQLDQAVAFLTGLGEDHEVLKVWIGVQCDIHNIKGDPYLSEKIARPGVDFALQRGHKTPAAMLLHNISAFYMQQFDESVDISAIPRVIQAAEQQVSLRRQLDNQASLGWSLWDLGLALLASGDASSAIVALEEALQVHERSHDQYDAEWARLFIGKTYIRYYPEKKQAGIDMMLIAAAVIRSTGQDWEKEELVKILETVGLE
jgi:hypothetical protein